MIHSFEVLKDEGFMQVKAGIYQRPQIANLGNPSVVRNINELYALYQTYQEVKAEIDEFDNQEDELDDDELKDRQDLLETKKTLIRHIAQKDTKLSPLLVRFFELSKEMNDMDEDFKEFDELAKAAQQETLLILDNLYKSKFKTFAYKVLKNKYKFPVHLLDDKNKKYFVFGKYQLQRKPFQKFHLTKLNG